MGQNMWEQILHGQPRTKVNGKNILGIENNKVQRIMGISQSNSQLVYYGESTHPIRGIVPAYSIKDQGGKFIMKTQVRASSLQVDLMAKIGRCENPKLVGYFGFHSNRNPNQNQQEGEMLWQLLNYDLLQELRYLRLFEKEMEQSLIWQIMDTMLEASKLLQAFGVYPELELQKIQFSAAKEPKLYWADILPNNMHRAYEAYSQSHQFRRALYSPEELLEITREKNKPLDKQKCVIFSMGMILLECASKKETGVIYDYGRKSFSEVRKRQILNELAPKYSPQLFDAIQSCLQYFPKDRQGYHTLQAKIQAHRHPGRAVDDTKIQSILMPQKNLLQIEKQEQTTEKKPTNVSIE